MTWTDERTALLKKLWAQGLSASQIAAELGGVSRSSVLGKAHRLGLPGRDPVLPPVKQRQPKPSRIASQGFHGYRPGRQLPAAREESAVTAIEAAPAESFRCTITDLTDKTCRWPIGNPGAPEFRFCGAPGADLPADRPYCPCHQRMAWARAA